MTKQELCAAAIAARAHAYAPYSGCAVGAALLTAGGVVYTGCNVENASYGATICAERSALCAVVNAGERTVTMLAVAGGTGTEIAGGFPPCGLCRQMLAEFAAPDCPVLVVTGSATFTEYSLGELLPAAFTLK